MTNCQGCTTPLPEDSRYCPRCGLAAGAAVPELATWGAEEEPKRELPPARSRHTESLGEAELLGQQPERPVSRRRRLAVALGAALVIIVGIVVGVANAGGGHKGPTSSLASSVPLQPSPTHTSPKAPITLPASVGDAAIQLAPAVRASPQVSAAMDVLSRYFTAINNHHDYARWRDTLVPTPDRGTLDAYNGYQTSHDSAISINAIAEQNDGSLRVSVGFTSEQAPQYGGGYRCLTWSIRYSLVRYQGQYRIDLVGSEQVNKVSC